MLASVALFVSSHYFAAGVVMAATTVCLGLLWPAMKALNRVVASPLYAGRRTRAAGLTFGAMAVVAAALLWLPVPVHINAQGIVWLPEGAVVRAGTEGFVLREEVAAGTRVVPGMLLLTLEHPIAEARMHVTEGRVDELRAKLKAEWVTDRLAAGVTGFELAQEEAALVRERLRTSQFSVVAASAGTFTPVRPTGDAPGRYVKEGDVLGWVTPDSARVARVLVAQDDMGLVQDRLRDVRLRLSDGQTELATAVLRAVPAAADELPSAALASVNGGAIATDPRDTKTLRAFERHFQFDLALPSDESTAPFGSRVFARFDCAWEPMGDVLYRRLRQALLSRFEA